VLDRKGARSSTPSPLGFSGVDDVRQANTSSWTSATPTKQKARARVDEMCKKLWRTPSSNYSVEIG
jgi:phosphoribosylformylglycinamidine (FGAM) synthase PurS component